MKGSSVMSDRQTINKSGEYFMKSMLSIAIILCIKTTRVPYIAILRFD